MLYPQSQLFLTITPGMKRTYTVAILVGCVGIGLLLWWQARSEVPKPSLCCVKVEPAEILNHDGVDQWLVTLCISNVNRGPIAPENYVFLKQTSAAVQCRHSGSWEKNQEAFPIRLDCGLGPAKTCDRLLLVTTGTESCRVSVSYTHGTLTFPSKIGRLVQSLPLPIRSALPYGFWRWVGFMQPVPSRSWREAEIDFDLAGVSPRPQSVP